MNQRIRKTVNDGIGIEKSKKVAVKGGMKPLTDSAKKLVLNGTTTPEQAVKTTYVIE